MKRYFMMIAVALFTLATMAQEEVPAFPGAEGHGRYVTGGRGGKVIHVTNLNNSGTGSLRSAVSGSAKKIIVFDVAGVIPLASDLNIGDNTTIAGQTAPYPGITIRYYTVQPGANNIIRFVRFRRGQERDVNDGADATWQRNKTGIILDHCSFSWSIDEVASFYDNNNFTMQWCTLGESLNDAGHGKGAHGYGGIWGGKLASFHHNLITHVANRSPRFNGARYEWKGYTSNKLYSQYKWENYVQAENVDFRNCVTYNTDGCYGGPGGGQINMVNNYMKSGPAATVSKLTQVTVGAEGNSSGHPNAYGMTSRYYVDGNLIDGNAAGWNKFKYDNGTITHNGKRYSKDPNHLHGANAEYITSNGTDYVCMQLETPAPIGEVTTHSALNAFEKVLSYSGASLFMDDVDKRYFDEARSGTAEYSGSVTKKKGRVDVVSDVNGYTEANFPKGSRPDGYDSDGDGMPDVWETANGLNPNDASDAALYSIDGEKKWYTNLEVFLSSLVEDIMKKGNEDAESTVNEYYPACTIVDLPSQTDGDDTPPVDPKEGTDASVSWVFSSGSKEEATYADNTAAFFESNDVILGSNLAYNGTKQLGDVKETKVQAQVPNESGPNEGNALTFTFKTKAGYKFLANKISFVVSRMGTDGGKFDATWIDAGGETKLVSGETPNRDNGSPSYSTYSLDLNNATATEGDCQLVFNIYALGQLKDDGSKNLKDYGFGNIQIQGKLTGGDNTAVEMVIDVQGSSRTYYNIGGQKMAKPQKGINIEVIKQTDGTVRNRKIILR